MLNQQSVSEENSRRQFLKSTVLTGLGGALYPLQAFADKNESGSDAELSLTIAGYRYDRIKALAEGQVSIKNCEFQFVEDKIGDMNTHVFSAPKTRSATEIGLLPFILAFANDEFRDYSLIPVFPLRTFRHKSIFIRTDRGINSPEDLRGKRIATPGYSSTSLTWIRGILQQEYGVRQEDINWVISRGDSSAKLSGGASKWESILPEGLSIENGPVGKDESDLLEDGSVDALFHAVEPRAFIQGHPKVARLFPDSRKTEQAYFKKTGIFPIMHAVAVKNSLADKNPWLPEALFHAYSQSKQIAMQNLQKRAWTDISLPWVAQEFEQTKKLMGKNYWPYGIEPNRKALEALLTFAHQQKLAKRKLEIAEIFHPTTLKLAEENT